jgi:hypothetical protein
MFNDCAANKMAAWQMQQYPLGRGFARGGKLVG